MSTVAGIRSILNFRDAGGHKIAGGGRMRKGLIYRSASPDKVSRKDLERLKELGISTIIDLRGLTESSRRLEGLPEIRVVTLPLDFAGVTRTKLQPFIRRRYNPGQIEKVINELYVEIVDAARPVMGTVADLMLNSTSRPMLIHCQAGKDRTGILSALFQMIAGVGREDIISDYMASNEQLIPHFQRKVRIRQLLMFGLFPARALLYAITQKREDIVTVLDRVENHYGGIEEYLAGSGFDRSRYAELREILIER